MIEGQLGRDRSDPERGKKDRAIDLDVLLSLRPDLAEISGEQVSVETYYRPQMLELIHALGFDCRISADLAGDAVEIEFEGCQSRLATCPGSAVVAGSCGRRPHVGSDGAEGRAGYRRSCSARPGNRYLPCSSRLRYCPALQQSEAEAQTAAADIRAHGARCELFQHDLCQIHHLDSMIASVASTFPQAQCPGQ